MRQKRICPQNRKWAGESEGISQSEDVVGRTSHQIGQLTRQEAKQTTREFNPTGVEKENK